MLIPPWCRAAALFLLLSPTLSLAQTDAAPRAQENPFKIAPKEGTKFHRDYSRQYRAWCERVLVTPAKARLAGSKFEKEAGQFIEAAMEDFATEEPMSTPTELARQGAKLDKGGCDEPLALFLAARCALKADGDLAGESVAKHALERALPLARKERDSGLLVVLIDWETAALRNFSKDARQPLDEEASTFLLQAVTEEKVFTGDDAAILVRMLCAEAGEDHFKRVHERYASICDPPKEGTTPALPEWARRTLAGHRSIRIAWDARGGGLADTVTEPGWEKFGKYLKIAEDDLREAWNLRPDQPYAAKELISVKMGNGDSTEDLQLWFERATAAQFDYYPAYSALMWALRPRWGGSPGLMLALGSACLESGRFDTEVPRVLVKACDDIASDLDRDWRTVYQTAEVSKRLSDYGRKLLKAPERAATRWQDASFTAVQAWATGDSALAEEALAAMPQPRLNRFAAEKLRTFDIDEKRLRGEVAFRRSPLAEAYEEAERHWALDRVEEATKAYNALLPKTPPASQLLVQGRLEQIAVLAALEKGDWVALPIKPNLPGWRVIEGDWKCTEEGTLSYRTNNGAPLIVFEQPPGENYELHAEMTGGASGPGRPDRMSFAGIVLGYLEDSDKDWLNAYVTNIGGKRVGMLRKRWTNFSGAPQKPVTLAEWTPLDVRVEGGKVTFIVNGETIAENFVPAKAHADGTKGLIGFTNFAAGVGFDWRIRNVKVRRLP